MTPEDHVRLAAAWVKHDDPRVICIACGGLREHDEPPCTCLLKAVEASAYSDGWRWGVFAHGTAHCASCGGSFAKGESYARQGDDSDDLWCVACLALTDAERICTACGAWGDAWCECRTAE